jgi:hypothetical protein
MKTSVLSGPVLSCPVRSGPVRSGPVAAVGAFVPLPPRFVEGVAESKRTRVLQVSSCRCAVCWLPWPACLLLDESRGRFDC